MSFQALSNLPGRHVCSQRLEWLSLREDSKGNGGHSKETSDPECRRRHKISTCIIHRGPILKMHRLASRLLCLFACALSACGRGGICHAGVRFSDQIRLLPGARVVSTDGSDASSLKIESQWHGPTCQQRLVNRGKAPVRVREVDLLDLAHGLPAETDLYGEGFQMLSQTGGTLSHPRDIGSYTDRGHYRLPETPGLRTVYGLLLLSPKMEDRTLVAFASCRRFNGKFQFNGERLMAVIETEDLELEPGQSWELEDLWVQSGPDRDALLNQLGRAIIQNHPRPLPKRVPTGWCSWYCFGSQVTAANITQNLDWIAKNIPELRYIQIDDGYQPWMGDWLDTGKAFGGDLQGVLKEIHDRGFEPAIWVAPFIASESSRLFHEHPDWFVKDDNGKPLRSDRVGFGGWRLAPWYSLDGTHPEAQRFLEDTFKTMRRKWGCTYFKLDATYWATLPGGHRFDKNMTRIEAYRRGMEAIQRGAGDAILLGCNHPLWASFGLIDASRSSLDIERSWPSFKSIAIENLRRGWQNGLLWWNDPDCLVLYDLPSRQSGAPSRSHLLSDHEYQFHATTIFATGGMLLSGDDLTQIPVAQAAMIKQLLPPTGHCAHFADDDFQVGITPMVGRDLLSVFNWGEEPVDRIVPLRRRSHLKDHWTGEDLGIHVGEYRIAGLPGRSARLIEALPVAQ